MDQFSTHSCVSRNHRQPSETSVPYYTYSPATDRLFWRHVKKKNVPWHILAPRAVACDSLHLRASAHLWHVSAFFCNREFLGISCYKKMAEHTIFMYSAIIAVLILLDSLTDQISHLSGSNLLFALVHDIDGAVAPERIRMPAAAKIFFLLFIVSPPFILLVVLSGRTACSPADYMVYITIYFLLPYINSLNISCLFSSRLTTAF